MLRTRQAVYLCFFFFNDTATTEIYTLSLHDALPIYLGRRSRGVPHRPPSSASHVQRGDEGRGRAQGRRLHRRSEEHTSELQSRSDLVCRLLLEKKTTHPEREAAANFSPPAQPPPSHH